MAISNYDRVGRALDLLKEGLQPFVERAGRHRDSDRAKTGSRVDRFSTLQTYVAIGWLQRTGSKWQEIVHLTREGQYLRATQPALFEDEGAGARFCLHLVTWP